MNVNIGLTTSIALVLSFSSRSPPINRTSTPNPDISRYPFIYLFFFLAMPHGFWDLCSLTRDPTWTLAVEAWGPNSGQQGIPASRFLSSSSSFSIELCVAGSYACLFNNHNYPLWPHIKEWEAEVPRSHVTCPRPQTLSVTAPSLECRVIWKLNHQSLTASPSFS